MKRDLFAPAEVPVAGTKECREGETAPVLAVGLLSAASLGFELLLLRWFAILYWHHFAHMIISMALLGLGIAGSILTVSQGVLLKRFHAVFRTAACGFALSLPLVAMTVSRIGFNPLEVVWDPGQGSRLAMIFFASSIPFVFSGFGIGLAMRRFPGRIAVLYRADLAGAAIGAMTAPLCLMVVAPQTLLRWLAIPALLAALQASRHRGGFRLRAVTAPLAVAALILLWPSALLQPVMSPYKDLPQTMRIPGVHPIAGQVSPAGIAVALESAQVPFRKAPGLSMLSPAEPPEQIALFLDGHSAGAIDEAVAYDTVAETAYMEWTTAELPYLVTPDRPRVLVLGSGGGTDIRHARLHGAAAIEAVEASGALLRVVDEVAGWDMAEAARIIEMEPRTFLAATRTEHDLIQISMFGTVAPYADAAQAMRENYLYTVEGMRLMLRRLSGNGVLSITMPLDIPPRAPVKLFATLVVAAEHEGMGEVAARTAAVRSWNSVTVLFGRRELTASQVTAIREFCRERLFDPVWYPSMGAETANRVNVLDHPYFHEAARELFLGDAETYLRRYPFHVRPATDDRPYFGRFFRWRSFGEWWAGRAAGTAPFLEWSYLLAWMLVAAALLLAVPLVGLPLQPLLQAAAAGDKARGRNLARGSYFTALGLAFLFLEIVFIQKFVLFLGHPVVSMAVVVPAFLIFAGIGSGYSEKFEWYLQCRTERCRRARPVAAAVMIVALIALVYGVALPAFFQFAAGWPMGARILVSIVLIGIMALWMGMPFPLGLKRLGAHHPSWIPLAWGINGMASVISAVGAGLLAMHAGFRMVTLAAILCYLVAAGLEKRL